MISTLGWIDVASLAVGVAGLGVGLWSIWKVRNAQEAETDARNKLLRRIAADEFNGLSVVAMNLAGAVSRKDWTESSQIAIKLIAALAHVNGSSGNLLIDPNDKDQLEVATDRIRFISKVTTAAQTGLVGEKQMDLMLSRCQSVVVVVNEIAGKLKYTE